MLTVFNRFTYVNDGPPTNILISYYYYHFIDKKTKEREDKHMVEENKVEPGSKNNMIPKFSLKLLG